MRNQKKANKFIVQKALVMTYLMLTLMLFTVPMPSSANEMVSVQKATGDLIVSLPLANVNGVNQLNHEFVLNYAGGDGIPINMPSSKVGLGWGMTMPSITREVMGIPDDLYAVDFDPNQDEVIFSLRREGNPCSNTNNMICPNDFTQLEAVTVTCPQSGSRNVHLQCQGSVADYQNVLDYIDAAASLQSASMNINVLSIDFVGGVNLFWDFQDESVRNLKRVAWWRKALFFVVMIVTVVASIILTALTGGVLGPVAAALVSQALRLTFDLILEQFSVLFDGITYKAQGISMPSLKDSISMVISAVGVNIGGLVDNIITTVNKAQSAFFAAQSLGALAGNTDIHVNRHLVQDASIKYSSNGMLYMSERYLGAQLPRGDIVNFENMPFRRTDFGQPDKYSVSGPFSGGIIPAAPTNLNLDELNILDLPSRNNFKFYPTSVNSLLSAVDIEARTDLFSLDAAHCTNTFDATFCNDERNRYVEHYIDQFIITTKDGYRLIYGDPDVEGSIVRVHREGFSNYVSIVQSGDSHFQSRTTSLSFTHHPVEWKLVAILGPDYEGPSYPLSDESNVKGSWIAFKYDYVFNLTNPSSQCAFNAGSYKPSIDPWEFFGDYEDDGEGNSEAISRQWFATIMDRSYLSEVISPTNRAVLSYNDKLDEPQGKPWNQGFSGHNNTLPWFKGSGSGTVSNPTYRSILGFNSNRHWLGHQFQYEESTNNPVFTDLWTPSNAGFDHETDCTMNMNNYEGYAKNLFKIDLYKRNPSSPDTLTNTVRFSYSYDLKRGFSENEMDGALTLNEVTQCSFTNLPSGHQGICLQSQSVEAQGVTCKDISSQSTCNSAPGCSWVPAICRNPYKFEYNDYRGESW